MNQNNEYPRIEIEVTEFNVYVMQYTTWNNYTELAHFPYSHYETDFDHYNVAINKANDFIKSIEK